MSAMVLATAMIKLYSYQREAVKKLKTGSILCGGVGSGKSLTALSYFCDEECKSMQAPKDLYIITTARKRDTLEWECECAKCGLSTDRNSSRSMIQVVIDSWNNIKKYISVEDAFFIFDEQRVIGSGTWVKSFFKITKKNNWILLSATPGDEWRDYIPVFVANGFYKNRSEFLSMHAVYNRFSKFPKIERYVGTKRLEHLRDSILVEMAYQKQTVSNTHFMLAEYDRYIYKSVMKDRWDPFKNAPIANASTFCYILRQVVNTDPSRIEMVEKIMRMHPKAIIFYNFNYELEILRNLSDELHIPRGEWNGHIHSAIPDGDCWMYLVQYTAGAEGWECITTDTMIFYSLNPSYRQMAQSAGRIDRLNTPFHELHYYILSSTSTIDLAFRRALRNRKTFNERKFAGF